MKSAVIAIAALALRAAGARAGPQLGQPAPAHPPTQVRPEPLPPVAAATRERRDLGFFEGLALANHPGLARAAARVQAARGQWVQEGLYPNPRIGYEGAEIGNEGASGMQGGFVEQEVVLGGKLGLNRAMASQEVREANAQFNAEQLRVLNLVRLRFDELLIAQRALELTEELGRLGDETLQTAETLLKAQEVSLNDTLQARIEANRAKVSLANARNSHTAAWQRLAAAAAVPDMTPSRIEGSLTKMRPVIAWQSALGQLLSSSPELAAAAARVDRAGWAARRAEAEPIPNLMLETMVQRDNVSQDTVATVRAGLPLPVWNRNQGGIRRAQAELAEARSAARQLELELTDRLASVFERYANARQQVERFSRDILPDAKASLDLVTKAFQQGETGYLTVLTAQRTYVETNLMYLEAQRQLRSAEVAIEGLLLTGGEAKADAMR
jgi:cobalt-zinc-cadmium efflux system outer membrane protein